MKPRQLVFTFFILIAYAFSMTAQSNPVEQNLTYSENFSALAATSTAYPAGIQGWKIGTSATGTVRLTAATADQSMFASGDASFSTGGIYNYNGKIGILSSGSIDPSLCFAINTTGLNGITVSFDVMTIRNPYDGTANTRIDETTLQYRVGTTGNFTAVSGFAYQNNTSTQITAVSIPQNTQSISVLLPVACDNNATVQLRWVSRDISGGGARPSFAFDNIFVSSCTTNTSTYYYRSRQNGNWSVYSTWEASLNGVSGWSMACSAPTSAAAAISIQSGHTVTINTNATAPNLSIDGTLTFDNTPHTVGVTDYVTVSSTGTFITPAAGLAVVDTMSIGGDLTNNGIFDMSRGGTSRICNVTFNKNGNQNVSGTGTTTRFSYIGLNMGTSLNNILNISSTNFSAPSAFLHPAAGAANLLVNGTLKLSGTYTFSGALFKSGSFYNIQPTAGIWINNPNVTITATADSYDVSGLLRISSGIFNAGSNSSNCIRLLNGSRMVVEGGTVNVGGRIQAYDAGLTVPQTASYLQSGGTVILSFKGQNTTLSPLMPEFCLDLASDSLVMSGGSLIFQQQALNSDDLLNRATSVITGGLVQMGNAATTTSTTAGFYIESYGALPSLLIYPVNSSTKVVLATNLTIKGDITISNATTLTNKYYTGPQTYNISLTGNWINNGTFLHNNSKTVTFNGSSSQSISGTSFTTFNNLTINNSSGGVTLQSPATVNNTLNLSNGYLYTDAVNILSMGSSSLVGAVSNASFVYGPMTKTGNTNFIFPVGKDLEYRPISISSLSASETFTAEYFHVDPSTLYSLSSIDPTITHIDGCEYWKLDPAGSATASVTLSWDTYSCGVTSLPDLTVARFDIASSTWKDEGNGGTSGTTSTGTIITSGIQTPYGPYTLASTVGNVNPLPIELINFTANYNGKDVDLKWTTESEINNDYFSIERSADATQFTDISTQKGAGNSTEELHYYSQDLQPLQGVSYYRLKQTDYNGKFSYSNVVAVNIENLSTFNIISISKNNNELNIVLSGNDDQKIKLELYDMSGKKILSLTTTLLQNRTITLPLNQISGGIYLLKLSEGEQLISRKIGL